METLYGQNIGENSPSERESEIIRHTVYFEQQLDEWLNELPPALRITSGNPETCSFSDSPTAARLKTILTIRYLNIRCLLHRPVLMALLANGGTDRSAVYTLSYRDKMIWESVSAALESAVRIITIMTDLGGSKKALGAYWFSLYYCPYMIAATGIPILCLHDLQYSMQHYWFSPSD